MKVKKSRERAATDREILEILGPSDNETIIEITKINATCAEIQQAKMWLDDDDYIGADLEKKMDSRIRRIYEILLEDQDRYTAYEAG